MAEIHYDKEMVPHSREELLKALRNIELKASDRVDMISAFFSGHVELAIYDREISQLLALLAFEIRTELQISQSMEAIELAILRMQSE